MRTRHGTASAGRCEVLSLPFRYSILCLFDAGWYNPGPWAGRDVPLPFPGYFRKDARLDNIIYALVPLAYLLGSIPTGVIVTRAFGGVDPRKAGSGNIGATNVSRTSGKLAGALTLLGDILKGALPVLAAIRLGGGPLLISLVGLAAFLGHLLPVFLGFRGGKGVATACGVLAVISPVATLLSAAVFVVFAALKRYVSLASMLSAAAMPVFLYLLEDVREYAPLGLAIAVLIIIKHKDNIKRLAAGTENRIGGKKG